MKKLLALLLILKVSTALGSTVQVLSFASDLESYPASNWCYFSNSRLVSYETGVLAVHTCFMPENFKSELWFVSSRGSKKIFDSRPGSVIGSPVVSGSTILATESHETQTTGLWIYADGVASRKDLPSGFQGHLHDLSAVAPGSVMFRFTERSGAHSMGTWTNGTWSFFDPENVSYFFSAASSSSIVLQKVRLGSVGDLEESRPDEIWLRVLPGLEPVTVLQDRDANPQSPYLSFRNFSVVQGSKWLINALTKNGLVAIVGSGPTYQEISLSMFKDIPSWPMALDDQGRVTLRALHQDGRNGLWRVTKNSLEFLLGEGSELSSRWNLKGGKEMFYTAPTSDGQKTFIGVGVESRAQEFLGQSLIELN